MVNARTQDLIERYEDFGLKLVYTIFNEYMKIGEYKSSMSFFLPLTTDCRTVVM